MKYIFEQKRKNSGFAGAKAPRDIVKILQSEGYELLYYSNITSNNRVWRNIVSFFMILKLLFVLKEKDECFLQWPLYTQSKLLIYYIIKWKHANVDILIHDLQFVRYNKQTNLHIEKLFFSYAKNIIVHTEKMRDLLYEYGISYEKMKVLTSFDYLTDDKVAPQRYLSDNVVYAGNLEKSPFLLEIMKSNLNISIFCYGKETYKFTNNITYKGFFNSENVSNIEGSWGLVWDGDSIESCSGIYGKYLKFNSPHKLSLYIVALLPIIIWEGSALAGYVIERKLGFTIKKISDIPKLLSNITSEEYEQLLENVKNERKILTNGTHLKNCLAK